MNLLDLISHDCKTRIARPASLLALVLFVALLAYAASRGSAAQRGQTAAIAAHQTTITAQMQQWHQDLVALEKLGESSGVSPWAGSAMDLSFPSSLPPAPLGDFAIGQADLLPYTGAISLWDLDVRLFSKYQFADPVALALGGFDLARAILLLLPLVLIVLCYDVLSSERDSSRLALLLAQGANLRQLFWLRLLLRGGLVLGLAYLPAAFALVWSPAAHDMGQRLLYFAPWCLCVFLYAACWLGFIALVAARNQHGGSNILLLLLSWTACCLVIPAMATLITESLYPTPSRAAYLAETRALENETTLAEAQIANGFINDHPEMMLAANSSIPAYVRTAFLVTTRVDRATQPVLAAFERSAQRREQSLGWLAYLSPTIITHRLFNELTGTSWARFLAYQTQARAMKASYAQLVAPSVLAGKRLPLQLAANLPSFQFNDQALSSILARNAGGLLALALLAAACLLLAHRRVAGIVGPDAK